MPTTNTNKLCLALAIGPLAVSALVASPGCVASVYRFNSNAIFTRNVRDLQEERTERPSVMYQTLLFSNPDPRSNPFKIFDHYCSGGRADSLLDDSIGHIPEQPFNRSLLESDIGSVIERDSIDFPRLGKRLRKLLGRLKFYLQSDSRLHESNIYHPSYWYGKRGFRCAVGSAQCQIPAAG
jgi:hypothetical protein